MNKKDNIENEYITKQKRYSEMKEELAVLRTKGLKMIDDISERSSYYLKDFITDNSLYQQTFNIIENEREYIESIMKKEYIKIDNSIEELETEYKKLKLEDNKD
ncbi:hypothetical protein [Miniphocaeibacter massiliensis]|uniref:hypothetical protein n=1 Tax=Miniphocaeibacter massiliensis TaxID=2041841 RepID=UPI000C07D96D|nr:hypothetical protein [Miniphocaeibacter massiliensis]